VFLLLKAILSKQFSAEKKGDDGAQNIPLDRELMPWLQLTCEIKLFCFISCVTTSETEIIIIIIIIIRKLFQPLRLCHNYFSNIQHVGKYSRAAISPRNNFEIISGKFPHDEG